MAIPSDEQRWSFLSLPDHFNHDYADLSGGADAEIAAVFGVGYADGLVPAQNWTPVGPNGMTVGFATALHAAVNDMVESAHGDPAFVLIAGDLTGGHWPQNPGELKSMFGDASTTLQDDLDAAAETYYTWLRKLFEISGVDKVVATIGDHDIGDNGWRVGGPIAPHVNTMKQAFGAHVVDPLFEQVAASPELSQANAKWADIRFAPGDTDPNGLHQYDEASFVYQERNVLFLNIDVFRYEGAGVKLDGNQAVAVEVTGEHLDWVRSVLERAEADDTVDHVIVQGHTPILSPVAGGSYHLTMNGAENSPLWRTMAEFGTDNGGKLRAYFCGETHATTTIVDESSGIVQINHGSRVLISDATVTQADSIYLAIDVTPERLDITEYRADYYYKAPVEKLWEVGHPERGAYNAYNHDGPFERGSLSIDVSTGSLDLTSRGSLAAVDRFVGQAGEVTTNQPNADAWQSVTFDHPMADPIVVMGAPTYNNTDEAHARVRNVTANGFEFQLEEWAYRDGQHPAETTPWFAVERGVHTFLDGSVIEAGSRQVDEKQVGVSLAGDFGAKAPVVIGQVASEVDADPVTHRLSGVSASGFKVLLEEEQARDAGGHMLEDFNWIAFEVGIFDNFAAGMFTADDTGTNATVNAWRWGPTLADMQTMRDGDTAQLRVLEDTTSSLKVFVEEDKSRDSETGHGNEVAGWVDLEPWLFAAPADAPTPPPPTPPPSPGPDTVVIDARGTPAYGQYAEMQVLVDGVLQGSRITDAITRSYSFDVSDLDAASTLEIRFTNDAWDPATGDDRNLIVTKVVAGGEDLAIGDATYERDGKPDIPGQTGLWWNGELNFTLDPQAPSPPPPPPPPPSPEPDTVVIDARGTPAYGQYAEMQVLVDGVLQGSRITDATTRSYSFDVSDLDAASTLEIRFPNNARDPATGDDRNLIVTKVVAGGEDLAIGDATYERDGKPDIPGQTGLWWNGELNFTLDPQAPSPPPPPPPPPSPEPDTVVIDARGTPAYGQYAKMQVLIDGVLQGSRTVDGTVDTYAFSVSELDSASTLAIRFANDALDPATGDDRNLIVTKVIAGGEELAIGDAVYDRDAASLPDIDGQSGMWWQGNLVFDVDALLS